MPVSLKSILFVKNALKSCDICFYWEILYSVLSLLLLLFADATIALLYYSCVVVLFLPTLPIIMYHCCIMLY